MDHAMSGGPLQPGKFKGWVPFGSSSENGELRIEIDYTPPPKTGVLLITAHEVGTRAGADSIIL